MARWWARVLPAGQHPVRLADQQDQAEEARRDLRRSGRWLNVAFYKQLKAAGITADKQTLLTLSVTEDELLGIGGENMAGFYASMKYFQSLDNPNNAEFVKAFKAKYGSDAVIGDVTQAAYLGPWLWKAAVERPAASMSTRWSPPPLGWS